MITDAALILKLRARWQHYLVQARWKRADRIKQRLERIQDRLKSRPAWRRSLTA